MLNEYTVLFAASTVYSFGMITKACLSSVTLCEINGTGVGVAVGAGVGVTVGVAVGVFVGVTTVPSSITYGEAFVPSPDAKLTDPI